MSVQNTLSTSALALVLMFGAAHSSRGGTSVAVNFSGRGVNNDQNTGAFLTTAETAGVVPQAHWNNVDISGGAFGSPFVGTTTGLIDSGYNFTGVRVIYDASDSWSSGGGTGTSDQKLMKGIIKQNPGPDTAPTPPTDRMQIVITNVPAGSYNVYVYLMENDVNCTTVGGTTNVCAEGTFTIGATSFYVSEESVFGGSFIKATSTTPGAYADANYAEFDAVAPVGNAITITATKHIVNPQVTDGIGIAGVQLIQVSGSAYPPNTDTCAIVTPPSSTLVVEGGTATFNVTASGPCKFAWTTNGVTFTGQTNSTLIFTPVLANNNMQVRAIVYNNVVTNTSPPATLTVDANTPPTLTQGFLKVEQWQNLGPDTGSSGIIDLKTNLTSNGDPISPTLTYYVGGAGVAQTSPDVDNFGDRIWGWVKPDVSGSYTFFLRSDDSAELFINTTAAGGSGTNTLPNPQSDQIQAFYYGTDGAGFAEPPNGRTSDPISLTAGKLYGMVIMLKCAGGTDLAQVAWRLAGDTTPAANLKPIIGPNVFTMATPAGQRASFTTLPQPITVVQGRKGTFTASVTTTPTPGAYSIQWLTNNVLVPGAQGNTYTTPQVLYPADNGMQIKARALTLVGSTDSPPAILTVIQDTNPPVATAGSITKIDGTIEVGFSFDEPINPSSLVSGNFSVLGHTSTFKLATNSYNTYQGVVLDPSGLSPGNTYTARVQNVSDPYGNVMPQTDVPFVVSPVKWAETGVPIRPGQVIPQGATGFDILNGGRKEWDSYDEVTMAYVKKTNDFDVQVQVVSAEPGSQWTRVGLQARNSLDTDVGSASTNGIGLGTHSAYAQTHVNPNQSIGSTGLWPASDPIQPGNPGANNSHEQNTRLSAAASTTSWGTGVGGTPNYPNVWLRLKRVGTNIFGMRSEDGRTWTDQGSVSLTDQTNVMSVGVSLSMETGNIWGASPGNGFDVWGPSDPACAQGCTFDPTYDRLILAQFRNFIDVASISTLSIAMVAGHPTITFSGALQRASVVGGPYVDVAGATSPYNVPAGPSTGFYRVRGTLTPQ
jgi:hypothetical protein